MIERHGLKDGDRMYAVNTSAMWFRKGPELAALQAEMFKVHRRYTRRDLVHKWGNSIPDELCVTAACAVLGMDPTMPSVVCYFERAPAKAERISNAAYVLPLYGSRHSNGCTSEQMKQLYDGQIRIMRGRIDATRYASRYVMAHKFIDHQHA
jgi:hypothetical protein